MKMLHLFQANTISSSDSSFLVTAQIDLLQMETGIAS